MATKRVASPGLVQNPFIKKRNLEWSIDITGKAHDAVGSSSSEEYVYDDEQPLGQGGDEGSEKPKAAAIESGEISIDDHTSHFSNLLTKATLSPFPSDTPHLPVERYQKLYETNAAKLAGAHFIIHQHDHPIAGTHYDLRLQINETSSVSWAIMYGPPGDPNSFKLNRNATETRIHCLWGSKNHLIETASHATGSLLIWDTGTYSVLPIVDRKSSSSKKEKEYDSQSSAEEENEKENTSSPQRHTTEQEKLHQAFAARKIRLQLHGTRLPSPYVLNLHLTREEDAAGRARSTRVPKTRRRRCGAPSSSSLSGRRVTRSSSSKAAKQRDTSSDSDDREDKDEDDDDIVHAPTAENLQHNPNDQQDLSAMERELRELEDEEVRKTNAYSGASNTIGSVYQRRWYLSLDRERCGFVKRRQEGRVVWKKDNTGESEEEKKDKVPTAEDLRTPRLAYPFYVRGVEYERSVVTGRLGSQVLRDEGVVGYVGRKGWQAITK